MQKKITETSQEYRTWKDQYEKEKKIHGESIMQREKEAEILQSKMRLEQEMRVREEKHKYKEEAQEGRVRFQHLF